MLSWQAFAGERPDLAEAGRRLFYQHGIGLGFLATVRADGGPGVHPICPVLTDDGLFGLILPGPKLADLRRDPRYALHSETCPPPHEEDAFYVTGVAEERADPELWERVAAQMLAERGLAEPWADFERQVLWELTVERCLVTLTREGAGLPRGHTIWRHGADG